VEPSDGGLQISTGKSGSQYTAFAILVRSATLRPPTVERVVFRSKATVEAVQLWYADFGKAVD
jgi:hypothetical protein